MYPPSGSSSVKNYKIKYEIYNIKSYKRILYNNVTEISNSNATLYAISKYLQMLFNR